MDICKYGMFPEYDRCDVVLATIKRLRKERQSWAEIAHRLWYTDPIYRSMCKSRTAHTTDACLMEYVVMKGYFQCMVYLHGQGCPWNSGTCRQAAKNGMLVCLKYAIENGCPWDRFDVCYNAALEGHINCLRYAHEMGGTFDSRTVSIASTNASVDCLKYLHEHGGQITDYTANVAAWAGNVECLKYVIEHGGPLTEDTCVHAICAARLETLTLAHENGAPITEKAHEHAVGLDNKEIMEYTRDHCIRHEHTKKCLMCALLKKQWREIDWSDPRLQIHVAFQSFLAARKKIYLAMERCYLNPRYSWCIRRLHRQFHDMTKNDTHIKAAAY